MMRPISHTIELIEKVGRNPFSFSGRNDKHGAKHHERGQSGTLDNANHLSQKGHSQLFVTTTKLGVFGSLTSNTHKLGGKLEPLSFIHGFRTSLLLHVPNRVWAQISKVRREHSFERYSTRYHA